MNFCLKTLLSSLSMTILLAAAAHPGDAASPPAKGKSLANDLEAAKIMPKGYKLNVAENPDEVLVQTHEVQGSDVENDCRIDAVLIAKFVMKRRPQAAKVTVRFFNNANSAFHQVTVTAGDVIAYGSGGISKEKLLQSLTVINPNTETFSARERSNTVAYHQNGVAFYVPSDWKIYKKEVDNYMSAIDLAGTHSWSNILVRKQNAMSAEQQAGYDEMFYKGRGDRIVRQGPAPVGMKRMNGYELLVESRQKPTDPPRYEQHIYFGNSGAIYSLSLNCAPDEMTKCTMAFQKVLSTVSLDQ